MAESRKKKFAEIEQQISICKSKISMSEGKFVSNLARSGISFNTPQKPSNIQTTPNTNQSSLHDSRKSGEEDDVASFIRNLNDLRGNLEEKISIMSGEYERNLALMQSQSSKIKSELKTLQMKVELKQREIKDKNEENNVLRSKYQQLQKILKEKQNSASEELNFYKKENAQVKLQNKSLKADNKIIMNHLDRITKQLKEQPQKKASLEERELRVMKSLYQETLPNIELKEAQKTYAIMDEPRNKLIADDLTERNGELKSLIRRQNQEIELLKREKQLLVEENKQKYINLENQKLLVSLIEEEKKKLNNIIAKMGEKIMSLEEMNQTLKETIAKAADGPEEGDESYYRTTRTKVGQFYYKK